MNFDRKLNDIPKGARRAILDWLGEDLYHRSLLLGVWSEGDDTVLAVFYSRDLIIAIRTFALPGPKGTEWGVSIDAQDRLQS